MAVLAPKKTGDDGNGTSVAPLEKRRQVEEAKPVRELWSSTPRQLALPMVEGRDRIDRMGVVVAPG